MYLTRTLVKWEEPITIKVSLYSVYQLHKCNGSNEVKGEQCVIEVMNKDFYPKKCRFLLLINSYSYEFNYNFVWVNEQINLCGVDKYEKGICHSTGTRFI